MLTIIQAQCCRIWPVIEGRKIRECGKCGKKPIVLPALGRSTMRIR